MKEKLVVWRFVRIHTLLLRGELREGFDTFDRPDRLAGLVLVYANEPVRGAASVAM